MPKKKKGGGKKGKSSSSDAKSRGGKGSKGGKEGDGQASNVTLVLPFSSMAVMASHLARVSAFLEDPQFHGKPVGRGSVDKLVASRYAGHNFSLSAFRKAVGALGELTAEEERCRSAIDAASRKFRGSNIYIIAHVKTDVKTLQHERWHAVYHFDEEYRNRVRGIWGSVEKGNPSWAQQFEKHLSDKYASHVWVDEFQAIVLNREYECAMKTVNLLQSILPKQEPFKLVPVAVR